MVGIKRGSKKKKSVRVRVWRRKKEGKKKEKRRRKKCGSVWRIKKEGKKKDRRKWNHIIFTINFKW